MTFRSHSIILIITFCFTNAFMIYGQSKKIKGEQIISKYILLDTSKTAIIPFEHQSDYPFNKSYEPAFLSPQDINQVDSLFIACVSDYNKSLDKNHKNWNIDLKRKNYRKQLVVVKNKKGEKEVWINCFCDTWGNNKWKTVMIVVVDGGNCYFNFKINLKTKKFYDLNVNSLG